MVKRNVILAQSRWNSSIVKTSDILHANQMYKEFIKHLTLKKLLIFSVMNYLNEEIYNI